MADHPPIPQEAETLAYELFVLRRMVEQLPGQAGVLILQQLTKTIHALSERDRIFREKVGGLVDDAILEIKFQEFDLESTKKERDQFKDRLDQI